jgi:hypothetical protein
MIYSEYVVKHLQIQETFSGDCVYTCTLDNGEVVKNQKIDENIGVEDTSYICLLCSGEYIYSWRSPLEHFQIFHAHICAWCHCVVENGMRREHLKDDMYMECVNHGICDICKTKLLEEQNEKAG